MFPPSRSRKVKRAMLVGHGPQFSAEPELPPPGYTEKDPETNTKQPEMKKKTTLGDIVTEFGLTATAHGIPNIITYKRWWVKLFWAIVSCGLAAVFGLQGYKLLTEFFTWPYNTKIDVISKSKVDFPAVTVCNMNRMRRSELVGTRFQGLVDIDGGFDVEEEYSWFWDFSSDFYNNWYSDWDWYDEYGGYEAGNSTTPSPDENSTLPAEYSTTLPPTVPPVGRKKRDDDDYGYLYDDYYYGWYGDEYYYADDNWWDADWYDGFEDFNFDEYESWEFEYDDYYDWNVQGESDWHGFYAQSKTDDYSDIAGIANPTVDELRDYGHQAEDLILQCTFDKRGCNHT